MAANEAIWSYGNQVVIEGNGTGPAANAFAAGSNGMNSTDHGDRPLADFVLYCGFGANLTIIGAINLYRCDQGIDGSNNAPTPSANCPSLYVGAFTIPNGISAAGAYPLPDVPLGKNSKYHIENKTGQSMNNTWTLKATPKTYKPSAS